MQFRENSAVYTVDGKQVGVIDRVVIDPGTQEVSHLIVRRGWFFTEDKVVPMALIAQTAADEVHLRADIKNLDDLPRFEETHYVAYDPATAPVASSSTPATNAATPVRTIQPYYAYPPVRVIWPGFYGDPMGAYALGAYPTESYKIETERHIPDGTVALKEGATVVDKQGEQVGKVAQILMDDQSQQVTHLLITAGWLFPETRLIPINWVKEVTDEEVHLQVSADFLKHLPERRLQPA